jgi:hypothetical protein
VPSGEFGAARPVGRCVMTSAVIMQCYHAVCYQVAESRRAEKKNKHFVCKASMEAREICEKKRHNLATPVQSSAKQCHDSCSVSLDVLKIG